MTNLSSHHLWCHHWLLLFLFIDSFKELESERNKLDQRSLFLISDQRVFSLPWRHLRRQLVSELKRKGDVCRMNTRFLSWESDLGCLWKPSLPDSIWPNQLLFDALFKNSCSKDYISRALFPKSLNQRRLQAVGATNPRSKSWENLVLLNIGQLLPRTSNQHPYSIGISHWVNDWTVSSWDRDSGIWLLSWPVIVLFIVSFTVLVIEHVVYCS